MQSPSFCRAGMLTLLLLSSLVSSPAAAIPYFNVPFGFDNSTLNLEIDRVIPLDADFPYIASGDPTLDLALATTGVINDTPTMIDRTITWTLVNNDPLAIGSVFVFLTALQVTPGDHDYSGALIDVDITGHDPMEIGSFGPYTFAGFYLTPSDFTVVGGELVAQRQFSYTVDEGEASSGPPDLGIAYVSLPEPGTGLLMFAAVGLLGMIGRNRRAHNG